MDLIQIIMPILISSTVPGACGGLGLFLFSLQKGHYKNNRYKAKLLIELLGAMIVASFVGPLFPEKAIIFASFSVGLCWATIIQITRNKITKAVKALIGEEV